MDKEQAKTAARGNGSSTLILGIWLVISPYIFNYTSGAIINSVILGIVVAGLAIVRLSIPNQMWANWSTGIAGLWLVLAPYIFGFMEPAVLWNEIIVGVIVAGLGFWSGTITTPMQTTHHHAA